MKIGCRAYLDRAICEMRGCLWEGKRCVEVSSTTDSVLPTIMAPAGGGGEQEEGNGIVYFLAVVGVVSIVLVLLLALLCCLLRRLHLAPAGIPVAPVGQEGKEEKKSKEEADKKTEEEAEKKTKEEAEKKTKEEATKKFKKDEKKMQECYERKKEVELEKIAEQNRRRREEEERNNVGKGDEAVVMKQLGGSTERKGLFASFGFATRPSRPGGSLFAGTPEPHILAPSHLGPFWGRREEDGEGRQEGRDNLEELSRTEGKLGGGGAEGIEGVLEEEMQELDEVAVGGMDEEGKAEQDQAGVYGMLSEMEEDEVAAWDEVGVWEEDEDKTGEGDETVGEELEPEGDGERHESGGIEEDEDEVGDTLRVEDVVEGDAESDEAGEEDEVGDTLRVEDVVEGDGDLDEAGSGEEGEAAGLVEAEDGVGSVETERDEVGRVDRAEGGAEGNDSELYEEGLGMEDDGEESYKNIVRDSGTDEVEETEEDEEGGSRSSSRTGMLSLASTSTFSPVAHSTAVGGADLPPLPSDDSFASSSSSASASPAPAAEPGIQHDAGKTSSSSPRKLTPFPVGPKQPYLRSDAQKKRAEQLTAKAEAEIRAKMMAAAIKAKVVPEAAEKEDSDTESD